MNIGSELKKVREELGLSQEKMAGNVLTKSYYSKIERGEYEIKACDLKEILSLHGIKTSDFFESLESKESWLKYEYYLDRLRTSFYKDDLNSIKDIKLKLENEHQTREVRTLLAHTILLESNLKNTVSELPSDKVNLIKRVIFEVENWNKYNLRLFSMAMSLFEINEVNTIIKSILDKYDQKNREYKELIHAILVNYLNMAFTHRSKDKSIIQFVLLKLKQMDPQPQNCFALIMCNYYDHLLNKEYEDARMVLDFLNKIGLKDFVKKVYKRKL